MLMSHYARSVSFLVSHLPLPVIQPNSPRAHAGLDTETRLEVPSTEAPEYHGLQFLRTAGVLTTDRRGVKAMEMTLGLQH